MRYYLQRNGEVDGPYPVQQIRQWFRVGEIDNTCLVKTEFGQNWVPLGKTSIVKAGAGTWILIGLGGLAVTCAVGVALSRPKAKPAAVAVETEAPRRLCEGEPRFQSLDVWVCTELGGHDGDVEVRTQQGGTAGMLSPPTKIALLEDSSSGPSEIRRAPGHMDQKICPLEGTQAGRVVYVQNTHVMGHRCVH